MIEILVVRDPDSADEITVWRDGYEITEECLVAYVDPGAGWSFEDWRESADAQVTMMISDTARDAVAEAFFDPPQGHRYIEGFKELGHPPMHCRTCGRYGNEEDMCVVGEECPADDCDGTVEYNWKDPE